MRFFAYWLCCLSLLVTNVASWAANDLTGKKVFFINSYHAGYEWSDGIQNAALQILKEAKIQTEVFYLDAKQRPTEAEKQANALLAKQRISAFKPDLVIVSDDDAVKYVLVPYFKNGALPFVFCGVNWDASEYALSPQQATGVLEIDFHKTIVQTLEKVAKGKRVGIIGFDGTTEQKLVNLFFKNTGINLEKVYLEKNFENFKTSFLNAQQEVDILVMSNLRGIEGWNDEQAQAFIYDNSKIPIGTTQTWITQKFAMLGIIKLPEEQGQWAANIALRILGGEKVSSIPIAKAKKGKVLFNKKLADKLQLQMPKDLSGIAEIIQ